MDGPALSQQLFLFPPLPLLFCNQTRLSLLCTALRSCLPLLYLRFLLLSTPVPALSGQR